LERTDKQNYYLDIAETVSERGTCLRRNFGSIIVNHDQIISTGYTGAPRGRKNCSDIGHCVRNELNIPRGQRYEVCLSGDTMINADGRITSIATLTNTNAFQFDVLSVDKNHNITKQKATIAFYTGIRDDIFSLKFKNGSEIKATQDHQFLMKNFQYKKLKDIKKGDVMFSYYDEAIVESVTELKIKIPVYDITVPATENFAIQIGEPCLYVFAHNCRSVHSEANAIIAASRDDMIGSTLYLVGKESTGEYVTGTEPCSMCKRMIINAGIKTVIVRDDKTKYRFFNVQDWIDKDDSLSGNDSYEKK
jgi:deoxycytidylate deaminase